MTETSFQYEIIPNKDFLLMELKGVMNEKGIKEATGALLEQSLERGIRKVLYDASELKQSDEVRKVTYRYFKFVSQRMDKMASFLPNRKIYSIALFLGILSRTKNWKPFYNKEKAIEWLIK